MENMKCPKCGNITENTSGYCSKCGFYFGTYKINNDKSINKTTGYSKERRKNTLLWCVFLGFFGAHRFYLKRYVSASVMLLLGILQLAALSFVIGLAWWIYDLVRICSGSFFDAYDEKQKVKAAKNEEIQKKRLELQQLQIKNDKKADEGYFEKEIQQAFASSDDIKIAIDNLIKSTGISPAKSKYIMQRRFSGLDMTDTTEYTQKKQRHYIREQEKLLERQRREDGLNALASLGKSNKKKGVAYENKKLSIGRAAVGYGIAGPTGAILGGLSSNKRQAVDPETGKKLSKREVKKRSK